ncbi:hypothetical protein CA265_06720 [Sphingobacteriaceae bacterium GW460-11-11-14-LB5]|nr:hypothetical protein CA265_06720 [Sphingobacteriaceae bacterium GW460-11-11-14-LB5]
MAFSTSNAVLQAIAQSGSCLCVLWRAANLYINEIDGEYVVNILLGGILKNKDKIFLLLIFLA